MRRPPLALLALPLLLLALLLPGVARGADGGLELLSSRHLDARLVELTFHTPALATPQTRVRVLLPEGYDAAPRRRYPVLYLLHGANGNERDWSTPALGNAEAITDGVPLIVVMPDGGKGGFYTDWYNNGALGPPEWETYHIDELLPWIDAHFRTTGQRSGRAIAGLSMGGFGSMSYAARHPDLFVAAAAFSGAVDLNTPNPLLIAPVINLISGFSGGGFGSLFGLRATDGIRWRAHNPWDLAENLRGMAVTLRTGDGNSGGDYGGGGPADLAGATIEAAVWPMNVSLHRRLDALGIRHVWDDYGPGSHTWPYWRKDLRVTLPAFMKVFAEHRPPPSPFTFTAVEPRYSVYGWTVSVERKALELSTLRAASRDGFSVSGSGVATVTTAPLYGAGRDYDVTVRGGSGTEHRTLTADGDGRLTIRVPLGPANPLPEQDPPLDHLLTRVFTTTVDIAPAEG